MNLLEAFKAFLFSQDNKPSKVTVKNYLSDINHFVRWYENKFQLPFSASQVKRETIEDYKTKTAETFSASSIERHLSSLRKFFYFLKLEGQISIDPFKNQLDEADIKDPWHLKDFKSFLYVYNASHLTIKNYIIDIKQFLLWAEQVTGANKAFDLKDANILNHISPKLVEEYKQRLLNQAQFSPATINRKLSSLRKFVSWAQETNLIQQFSFDTTNFTQEKPNTEVFIPEIVKPAVFEPELIKPYSKFPPLRLFQKVTKGIILGLDATLITQLVSLIEKSEYVLWKTKGQPIFEKAKGLRLPKSFTHEHILGIKNLPKELYAPLEVSTKHFPWHKKAIFTLRYQRPNWYKTYHSYAITHYFHFAVLIIFLAGLALGFYNAFGPNNQTPTFAALPTAPPRVLSFQGRLTDNNDNPITSNTNLRFAIYNDLTATGAALLWQEVDNVVPDPDGIFNIILGNNTTIPSTLFSENAALWLGVTVEWTPELTPRQQLATVAYATNSETLQGLVPITAVGAPTENVVLALDSSGNLTIGGSADPIFQATGGPFRLSGQTLLLTSNAGSNGNVQIAPDGTGKVDLTKPLINTSISNNISTARGAVEVNDLFAILATSSGQSALTINQTGGGPIISASASGVARFTVDNAGNIDAAGTATLSTSLTFRTSGSIQTTSNLGLTLGGGTTGTITLAPNNGQAGGVVAPSTNGNVDLGTSALSFRNIYGAAYFVGGAAGVTASLGCVSSTLGIVTGSGACPQDTIDTFWNQLNGALFPNNSTVDFLVGGQSSNSAKFRVTGSSPFAGTLSVASVSGRTSFATLVVNNDGVGDLFAASSSSQARFSIKGNGQITANAYQTCTLKTDSTGLFTCGTDNAGGGDSLWVQSNGLLFPANSTVDLSIGGQSSASAKFLFANVNSGTPTFKVFNTNSTQSINLFHDGTDGNITASTGTINIGAGGGTLYLDTDVQNDGSNNLGAVRISDRLNVFASDNVNANAALIVNNAGTGDIFTASAGGTQRFTVTNAGGIRLGTNEGLANNCLLSGGTGVAASWNACPQDTIDTFWNQLNGALFPNNSTVDFLVGGQSSNSAKFRVTGSSPFAGTLSVASVSGRTSFATLVVNNDGVGDLFAASSSGIPRFTVRQNGSIEAAGTASIASSLTFKLGGGTIQTTNNQLLTLGGATTGNISFNPNNTQTLLLSPNRLSLTGTTTVDSTGPLSLNTVNNQTITTGTGLVTTGGDIQINGNDIQDSAAASRINFSTNTITLGSTTTLSDTSLATFTTAAALGMTSTTTLTLGTAATLNSNGTTLNIQADGAIDVNIAGGQSTTGCTIFNSTGNLGCSGNIYSTQATGVNGWWNVANGSLFPLNSTLDFLLGGQSSASAKFRVTGASPFAGTLSVASVSGRTSFATLVVNNDGVGDLFTASSSSQARFSIKGNGQITANAYQTCTLKTDSTGLFTCGTDLQGSGSGFESPFRELTGAIVPLNSTLDFFIGGQSSASAKFALLNMAAGDPTASISGNLSLAVPTGANPAALLNILNGGSLNFQTSVGGNAGLTSRLFIANNGNIGIGTTNPQAKLDIAGSSSTITNSSGDITITPTGNLILGTPTKVGVNTSTPLATLDIRGHSVTGGTTSIASISGRTSFAALITNNDLVAGDLFAASSSSQARFSIKGNGQITANAYKTCNLETDSTGLITCGIDDTGSGSYSPFQELTGAIVPNNSTLDFLIGGQATTAAKFAVLNVNGSASPIASLSATTASGGNGNGIVLSANGTIQTLRENALTIGGDTTGLVNILSVGRQVFATPGFNNTLVGVDAGRNSTGTSSAIFGFQAGYNLSSGNQNTFLGNMAGFTTSTTLRNTYVGNRAGYLATANDNTYVGNDAGFYGTSGGLNVAVGGSAMKGLPAGLTGSNNAAFGYEAGVNISGSASNNTLIGPYAGSDAIFTGSNNTFIGYEAGLNTTTGSDNTFIGYDAGQTNTTGRYNVRLGMGSDGVNNTDSSIVIGYFGSATANNQLVIGSNQINGEIYDAYFGQGVTDAAPTGITLNATGGTGTDIAGGGLTLAGGKGTGNAAGGDLIFQTSDQLGTGSTLQTLSTKMIINEFGKIGTGLNNTNPLASFDVRGLTTLGSNGGTLAVASISGKTSFAALIANNNLVTGDLFAASSSSQARFSIKGNGQIVANAYQTCNIETDSTGLFICGTDDTGGGAGYSPFQELTGAIVANNTTLDFILGGQATTSAKFRVTGASPFAGTLSVASISGRTSFASLVVDNQGAGDLFTASASGVNRFVITNQGNVGVGLSSPLARVDIKDVLSGATQGSEKITNGDDNDFDTNTGNWTDFGSWTITNSLANKDAVGADAFTLSNSALDSAPVAGNIYRIEVDFTTTASSSGSVSVSFGGGSGGSFGGQPNMNEGVYVFKATASNTNALSFTPTAGWYGTLDFVFVYPITTNSIALRIEPNNGSSTPIEIRPGRSGNSNIFIGDDAGYINVNGSSNNALGAGALQSNLDGSSNNAFGKFALNANTTGSNNSAFGDFALRNNVIATNNSAFGYESLQLNKTGDFNSAFGSDALEDNESGDRNTGIGNLALGNNTSGGFNSALGYLSLTTNLTGSNNSALGRNADVGVGHLYNATAIGAYARVDQSSSLILGAINGINSATESARIGIGTTAPLSTLDVRLAAGTLSVASISGRTSFAALVANNDLVAGDLFAASSSGQARFNIKGNGQITANAYKTCNIETDSTGLFICGTDDTGGAGASPFTEVASLGYVYQNNGTEDIVFGGSSTASAKILFTNFAGGTPTIGINTTTPRAILDVAGLLNQNAASISGNITHLFSNFSGGGINFKILNNSYLQYSFSAGGDAGLNSPQFILAHNGLALGSSGQLPKATLDVGGNTTTSGNLTFSNSSSAIQSVRNQLLTIGGNTTGNIMLAPNNGTGGLVVVDGTLQAEAFYDFNNTNYFLDPAATSTSLFTAGNVGIAIAASAPRARLDVGGDASISGNLYFYSAGTSSFVIQDNNNLTFRTSPAGGFGTERMRFTNDGKLGIGTTSPTASLHIDADGSTGAERNSGLVIQTLANKPLISTDSAIATNIINNDGTGACTGAANGVTLFTNTPGAGGQPGLLSGMFNCNTGAFMGHSIEGNSYDQFFGLMWANWASSPGPDAASDGTFMRFSDGEIDFFNDFPVARFDSGAGFSLDNDGTLGDATLGILEVRNVFNSRFAGYLTSAAAKATLVVNNTGAGDLFTASASGVPRFTIRNSGNVGIGTVVPDTLLHLSSSSDLVLATDTTGILTIGAISSTNITFDQNEIMARDCSGATCVSSDLYFNAEGQNGIIGIGTTTASKSGNIRLQVLRSDNSTAAAQIWNSRPNQTANSGCASSLCHTALSLRLGADLSVGNPGFSDRYINFARGNSFILGKVQGNGSGGISYTSSGGDYAEWFRKENINDDLKFGDLVCVNSNGNVIKCTTGAQLLGVISDNPAFIGNASHDEDPNYILVGLFGQINTYVNTQNGTINPGDFVAASNTPGVATKATKPGHVIGRAIEGGTMGRINIYVNPTWYDPDVKLTSTGNLGIYDYTVGDPGYTVPHYFTINDAFGNPIDRIGAFKELAVGNIKAGFIGAQQISTNALSVATENIRINGIGIRDYIAAVVSDVLNSTNNNIISPIASADQIHTNLISPLDDESNISLDLTDSKITIRNGQGASSSAVAVIDNFGNASFSGSLRVGNDATISGTLRASRIIADSIEGLNIQGSTISANYITNITNIYSSTPAAFPTLGVGPSGSSSGSSFFGDIFANNNFLNIATFSSQLAYVENLNAATAAFSQGLNVYGSTSLSDTSIVGQLAINGSMIFADNSINVLGNDLNLQPLRQGGLSIMAGLIYIDTNGNVRIEGDTTINGTLYANTISPINGNDLSIKLGTSSALQNGNLNVKNATGSSILSLNQFGDLIASGTATFAKLKLGNLVSQVQAVSSTEINATGSAGTGFINPYKTEMTINNTQVTEDSLIYITPTSNTNNQVLFLLRQVPGRSFTVGMPNTTNIQIPFNWIIIN